MKTFTLREVWVAARRRAGLETDDHTPFRTKYFSSYPTRPIVGIEGAELRELVRRRALPSLTFLPDAPHLPCVVCGTRIQHVNDGGRGFFAHACYSKNGLSEWVMYCATCESGPDVLADGPNAGGLIVWRCACHSRECWPGMIVDAETNEDILSTGPASSVDNIGTHCAVCGERRGTYRWGLFD